MGIFDDTVEEVLNDIEPVIFAIYAVIFVIFVVVCCVLYEWCAKKRHKNSSGLGRKAIVAFAVIPQQCKDDLAK